MDDEELPHFEKMLRNKSSKKKHTRAKARKRRMSSNMHTPSPFELKVYAYLDELGVSYIPEKTFPGLVSVLFKDVLLPLDVYIKYPKCALELDGVHHTRKCGKDKPWSLDRRKLNDKTRDLFCLQRGIPLLRISHKQITNYKEIICQFLQEQTKKQNNERT